MLTNILQSFCYDGEIILNQKPLYYVSMQYIVQKLFIAHFKLKWIEGWRF